MNVFHYFFLQSKKVELDWCTGCLVDNTFVSECSLHLPLQGLIQEFGKFGSNLKKHPKVGITFKRGGVQPLKSRENTACKKGHFSRKRRVQTPWKPPWSATALRAWIFVVELLSCQKISQALNISLLTENIDIFKAISKFIVDACYFCTNLHFCQIVLHV